MSKARQSRVVRTRKSHLGAPSEHSSYNLKTAAQISGVPMKSIRVYYRLGLVQSVGSSTREALFNDEGIHTLRRIEWLRTQHQVNLTGVKMILELMRELKHLRSEIRFWRDF